jgi:small-conductance mechanosensitive channel
VGIAATPNLNSMQIHADHRSKGKLALGFLVSAPVAGFLLILLLDMFFSTGIIFTNRDTNGVEWNWILLEPIAIASLASAIAWSCFTRLFKGRDTRPGEVAYRVLHAIGWFVASAVGLLICGAAVGGAVQAWREPSSRGFATGMLLFLAVLGGPLLFLAGLVNAISIIRHGTKEE